MGLYLCVFDGDDEIDGVEVGSFSDFGTFRDTVQAHLEHGSLGSRFPTLMRHSDCDGAWSPDEAAILDVKLETIARELETLPPVPLDDGWKTSVARSLGMTPTNRLDCFFDVDGEPAPRPPSSALPLFDGTWPSDSLPIHFRFALRVSLAIPWSGSRG